MVITNNVHHLFSIFCLLMMRLEQSMSTFVINHATPVPASQRNILINTSTRLSMISSGFTFADEKDDQILVSMQKPLGIILEENSREKNDEIVCDVVVADVDPNSSASKAGIETGDVLLAVQNAAVTGMPLEVVLGLIGNAPRV